MLMPEAAVDKDYCLQPWKDEVRPSWKFISVKPEPVAEAMCHLPYG
jgi:hypothetical protein